MNRLITSISNNPVNTNPVFDPQSVIKAELGRLIHAAIINKRFCQKLILNPLASIEAGYCGESFHFPTEFKESVKYVRAESLESFSAQLLQIVNSLRLSEKAVLHYQ